MLNVREQCEVNENRKVDNSWILRGQILNNKMEFDSDINYPKKVGYKCNK